MCKFSSVSDTSGAEVIEKISALNGFPLGDKIQPQQRTPKTYLCVSKKNSIYINLSPVKFKSSSGQAGRAFLNIRIYWTGSNPGLDIIGGPVKYYPDLATLAEDMHS